MENMLVLTNYHFA